MKKIAILTCLKSNDVCTRIGCLDAMTHRIGTFAIYKQDNIELVALLTCHGCKRMKFRKKEGMQEKLSAIAAAEITAVHIGRCCWQRKNGISQKCRYIKRMEKWLLKHHIHVIWGTHT